MSMRLVMGLFRLFRFASVDKVVGIVKYQKSTEYGYCQRRGGIKNNQVKLSFTVVIIQCNCQAE